ncbi:hypothetical protein RMATCC62417_06552 [Rhizopus microsporus]|nr:hypothetical protein RMATCC62417_06552 [Rhizopus microsporus]
MDAPWSSPKTLSITDSISRLSQEILDFEKYIAPTDHEQRLRSDALNMIQRLIESMFSPMPVVEAFGSFVTSLALPSSDVDIVIRFDKPVMPRNILNKIYREAKRRIMFKRSEFIRAAKTPIITGCLRNGVSVDISVQGNVTSSERTVTWIKEYPELKPLFMVLKQSLSAFRLRNVWTFEPLSAKTAGLCNFGLICLIVSYLQLHKPTDITSTDPEYYGRLLLGLLDYYAHDFNASKHIISVSDEGKYYPIREMNNVLGDYYYETGKLFIINPDEPGRNVTAALQHFDYLQLIFKTASSLLKSRLSKKESVSILSSIIKVETRYGEKQRKELDDFMVDYIYANMDETMYTRKNDDLRGSKKRRRRDDDDDDTRAEERVGKHIRFE